MKKDCLHESKYFFLIALRTHGDKHPNIGFLTGAIPLLAEEGWTRDQENVAKPPLMERMGWSLTNRVATMHSETRLVSDHPICAATVASRFYS